MSKLFKNSHPKSIQQPKEFKAYPHNIFLCVDALIKLYLVKTVALSCFISCDLPQRPASSRTQTRLVSDLKLILSIQH